MDAIIIFSKKRELKEPVITVEAGEGYRLVKVGICAGEDHWFGQPLPGLPVSGKSQPGQLIPGKSMPGQSASGEALAGQTIPGLMISEQKNERLVPGQILSGQSVPGERLPGQTVIGQFLPGRLILSMFSRPFSRRREKRKRLLEELEQIRLQKQYESEVCALEDSIKKMIQSILNKTEILDDCTCIYADSVKSLLLKDGLLSELWKRNWEVREFVDYREYRWARTLLPFATQTHFVILGNAPCIPEVTKACARRMKSLRWILPEKDYGEAVEDFADDFYDDYGLAIELQTVAGRNGFRTLCLEAVKPICILDFTEEGKLFWGGLASGSVWLDFASMEAKEKRLERLAPGIQYVSLKKLWRG